MTDSVEYGGVCSRCRYIPYTIRRGLLAKGKNLRDSPITWKEKGIPYSLPFWEAWIQMDRPHLICELSAADVEHVNYSLASWTLPTYESDLRVSGTHSES